MNLSLPNSALALAATALFFTLQPTKAAEPAQAEQPRVWRFATELDALPYATGGYYASAVAAREAWRFRGVAASSKLPGFMIKEGFEDKRTNAYALLVDRFVGARANRQEGFWIGGGAELWRNRIRREGYSAATNYNNLMLTVGGGYVWKFSRHFYLNPWAGAHFAVAGELNPSVSGRIYQQSRFTPEASIKIGYTF